MKNNTTSIESLKVQSQTLRMRAYLPREAWTTTIESAQFGRADVHLYTTGAIEWDGAEGHVTASDLRIKDGVTPLRQCYDNAEDMGLILMNKTTKRLIFMTQIGVPQGGGWILQQIDGPVKLTITID